MGDRDHGRERGHPLKPLPAAARTGVRRQAPGLDIVRVDGGSGVASVLLPGTLSYMALRAEQRSPRTLILEGIGAGFLGTLRKVQDGQGGARVGFETLKRGELAERGPVGDEVGQSVQGGAGTKPTSAPSAGIMGLDQRLSKDALWVRNLLQPENGWQA